MEPTKCIHCGGAVEKYYEDDKIMKFRCKYPKNKQCSYWSEDVLKRDK